MKYQENIKTTGYKGTAPFGIDNKLAWFIKMISQVIIFTIIYTIYIGKIQQKYHNLFIELGFVFLWFMVADILAFVIFLIVLIGFDYKMKYIYSRKKKRKNYNRWLIEYSIYTSFRCLIYVSGLITNLSQSLSEYLPLFLAYLFVWMVVFLISSLTAKGLSIGITKSV